MDITIKQIKAIKKRLKHDRKRSKKPNFLIRKWESFDAIDKEIMIEMFACILAIILSFLGILLILLLIGFVLN